MATDILPLSSNTISELFRIKRKLKPIDQGEFVVHVSLCKTPSELRRITALWRARIAYQKKAQHDA